MNWPQLYMCSPHPESRSHLPPHPIPLGCPRALALGALLQILYINTHIWNFHVRFGLSLTKKQLRATSMNCA